MVWSRLSITNRDHSLLTQLFFLFVGLVINKFNTQGTQYDHNHSFEQFVARLVTEKIQEYEAGAKYDNGS